MTQTDIPCQVFIIVISANITQQAIIIYIVLSGNAYLWEGRRLDLRILYLEKLSRLSPPQEEFPGVRDLQPRLRFGCSLTGCSLMSLHLEQDHSPQQSVSQQIGSFSFSTYFYNHHGNFLLLSIYCVFLPSQAAWLIEDHFFICCVLPHIPQLTVYCWKL